jgi:SAM-dependent methyltransferase
MIPGFYRQTSLIEDEHWWFIHRRRLVARLLEKRSQEGGGGRALDVGCGAGGNIKFLRRHCSEVVGLDISEYALELARAKNPDAELMLGDANRVGDYFRESSFDLITAFNILYHRWIEDEVKLLEQIARLLRPGGILVITEPAFELLRRRHDVIGYGARRYRRKELQAIVARSGMQILQGSYFSFIAFAPALLRAIKERTLGLLQTPPHEEEEVGEMKKPPPAINRLLLAICSLEAAWIGASRALPLGTGVFLLALKPEKEKR